MKLSKAATEYMFLMGQLFKARLDGVDDTDILDRMDGPWDELTEEELRALNIISRVLGRIGHD